MVDAAAAVRLLAAISSNSLQSDASLAYICFGSSGGVARSVPSCVPSGALGVAAPSVAGVIEEEDESKSLLLPAESAILSDPAERRDEERKQKLVRGNARTA